MYPTTLLPTSTQGTPIHPSMPYPEVTSSMKSFLISPREPMSLSSEQAVCYCFGCCFGLSLLSEVHFLKSPNLLKGRTLPEAARDME